MDAVGPRGRLALAILVATAYSVCYAAIKAGLPYAPPLRFAALRAVLAGATLLALVAIRRERLRPPRRLWPATATLAVVSSGFGLSAMFVSPSHAGAGLAAVLGNTGPLLVVVLAAVFLHERITRTKVASLALGLVGVLLIAFPRDSSGPLDLLAVALPLTAALSVATESVVVKRSALGVDFLRVSAWQYLGGGALLLLLSMALEPRSTIEWSPRFQAALLVLALPGSAFGTALWYWLAQRDDISRLSLALFLTPVLGLALGTTLFGEVITGVQLAGAALLVTACAILAVPPRARITSSRA